MDVHKQEHAALLVAPGWPRCWLDLERDWPNL